MEILKNSYKILKGFGVVGLLVAGSYLANVLLMIFFSFTCFSLTWLVITLFLDGSAIYGLLVLFLAIPLVIMLAFIFLASSFFISFFVMEIIATAILVINYWLIPSASFANSFDRTMLTTEILGLVGIAVCGIGLFIEAIQKKEVVYFVKRTWFYVPIYIFLFWFFIFFLH